MGWQSIRIVGAFACVILILLQKIQKMANKDMTFGYHPVIVDEKGIEDSWKEYMEKLMNEENEWDH